MKEREVGGISYDVSNLASLCKTIVNLKMKCTREGVIWSRRRGSNPQHSEWKSDALPIELLRHCGIFVTPHGGLTAA